MQFYDRSKKKAGVVNDDTLALESGTKEFRKDYREVMKTGLVILGPGTSKDDDEVLSDKETYYKIKNIGMLRRALNAEGYSSKRF